jgi:hypothetical protein
MSWRRTLAGTLAGVALLAAACAGPDRGPLAPRLDPRAPARALSDGATGGRAGFYFAPPLAPALGDYPGTFDPTLLSSLSVRVCPATLAGHCAGADVVLDATTKPALALDAASERYGVHWSPDAAGDYRVRVYLGATLLGFADVRAVETGRSLPDVPAGYVGMVSRATLRIQFRVETGIVGSVVVSPASGVAIVNLVTRQFTATVTDVAGNPVASPTVTWTSSDPSVATVSSAGLATGVSEGDAIITATSGGVSGTATVIVYGDLNAVIGVSTVFVPRADACGRSDGRLCESLVGDVVTDAMRATYGVDFAITNAGGLRSALTCPTTDLPGDFCPPYTPPPYPITRGQVLQVLPFGNRVVTLPVNGAELRAILERGVLPMPAANGGFPQVSGLCFTYDISAPSGSRVTAAVRQAGDGSCTGAPVDLTAAASYTVAENDFIAVGGDGYPDFSGRFATRELQDRVTAAYVRARTPIAPAIQGRIVCTTSGATACPVVLP